MCFSLAWLQNLLIWIVIIGAVFALVRLLLPLVLGWFGAAGSVIQQAIEIVMWAFVIIVAIYIVFGLIACLLGGGGLHLPALR